MLAYRPRLDSVLCVYSGKAGTVTIESFVAKKSGTVNYFTTSGKASFTATRSNVGTYSPIDCPEIAVEVTFSKINVYDRGLNLRFKSLDDSISRNSGLATQDTGLRVHRSIC